MLYIYHGPDSFSRQEAIRSLKAELDTDGSLNSGITTFEGRNVTPQELVAACNTPPFFSTSRLIIVEGLFQRLRRTTPRRRSRKTKETDDVDPLGAWQPLLDAVDTLPDTTALLFVEEDFAPSSTLFDALRARAHEKRFPQLKWDALRVWVRDRAQRAGLKLDQRTVAILIEVVGDDLWTLANELEKLAVYADGKTVREKDIRLLVAIGDIEIWALLDALVEGRHEAALRSLRRLFLQGRDAGYILQMIGREYRLVGLAREMRDQGQRSAEIGGQLSVPSWKLDRFLDQAARCPPERLKRAFRAMVDADASIKRGVYDNELALELLTYELTATVALDKPRL